jgi:hypothetical protein
MLTSRQLVLSGSSPLENHVGQGLVRQIGGAGFAGESLAVCFFQQDGALGFPRKQAESLFLLLARANE